MLGFSDESSLSWMIVIFFQSLIFFCISKFFAKHEDLGFFQEQRILSPTLDAVEHVNEFLLSLVPGDEEEYTNSDSV